MRRLFVAAVIAAASVTVIAAAAIGKGVLQPYSESEAFSQAYGAGESLPGMLDGEGEAVIPSSIAVAPSGDMLISDPAKRRVVIFDRSGGYRDSIPVDGVPIDAVPLASGTAVLTADERVMVFDRRGRMSLAQTVSQEVARDGLRRLSASRGVVRAETGRGDSFQVVSVGPEWRGVPEQMQAGAKSRGRFAGDAAFDPYYEEGGRVVRYAKDGTVDLDVRLHQPDLVTVDVVGQDSSGSFYVITEIGTEDGCRTECRRYSSQGVLSARFEVVSELSWSARSTAVAPGGTVYRLAADETGVKVLAYSPGGDSR